MTFEDRTNWLSRNVGN